MGGDATAWAVSTDDGVVPRPEILRSVLEGHHARLVAEWQGFTSDQWDSPSRNTQWSVHDTVRHVVDAMERGAAAAGGDNDLDSLQGFDPRTTPIAWLEGSTSETPAATIERFELASGRFCDALGNRLASSDDTRATTVYGQAHWTMNLAHLLWDSWIHERDVLLPLGIPHDSTSDEERLVGLYGVFMAAVPSKLMDLPMTTTVELVGRDRWTLTVSCDGDGIACSEAAGAEAVATGDNGTVVDALAGRGLTVADALPGAPEQLGLLAAFFHS